MRFTRLVTSTLRTDPAEAETASHRLMLRAGLISPVASGVYSYLPLGLRSLRKIENIIREEMDASGAQELRMPAIQPQELWDETGRTEALAEILFKFKDRRDRMMVLAPTHEEVITGIVRQYVESYRDLPINLYQIQTKFRDEPRPRAGLLRVREFDMKDAYSFDSDEESFDKSYQTMTQTYWDIYRRCGLSVIIVEADSGAIGGKDSHEFVLPAPAGEDTIISCSACDYAANAEKAEFARSPAPIEEPLPIEDVATPGIKTIAGLAAFLGIPEEKTLKAVFYMADDKVVFVVLRGDLDVNEIKLKNLLHANDLRLATDEEVEAAGLVAGFASPVGLEGVKRIADDSIQAGGNFVAGANREGYHIRNVNYPRDFQVGEMADIALVRVGYGCPHCDGVLEETRGIEVGHIFKLGTVYSARLGANYLAQDGKQYPIIMGCYGIGLGRLLAGTIEQHHDDKGIVFPVPVAPYHVHLVGLNLNNESVRETADDLYGQLWAAGIETLYDDRTESPGVKFNDADLLGLPLRIVVSPRNIKQGSAEFKLRSDEETTLVPLEEVMAKAREMLAL